MLWIYYHPFTGANAKFWGEWMSRELPTKKCFELTSEKRTGLSGSTSATSEPLLSSSLSSLTISTPHCATILKWWALLLSFFVGAHGRWSSELFYFSELILIFLSYFAGKETVRLQPVYNAGEVCIPTHGEVTLLFLTFPSLLFGGR